MAKSTVLALCLAFVLSACGDPGKPSSPAGPSAGPSGPPPAMGAAPSDPAPAATSWTGTLEKMGPSIHMEGTHRLVEGGKTVVLLKSSKVDLTKSEGKRVTVTGTSAPTVEGNATIVTVETVTP